MVNQADGRVIDLIESREKEESYLAFSISKYKICFKRWLSYLCAAIRKAHPEAHHISDRFHLVKNLTDANTQCMYRILSGRIVIPLTKEQKAMNEL